MQIDKALLIYQELLIIANSYNIMFALYSEAIQYYFFYKEQEKNINSVIFLNFNERNSINQKRHCIALLMIENPTKLCCSNKTKFNNKCNIPQTSIYKRIIGKYTSK